MTDLIPFPRRSPLPERERPSILAIANHLIALGDLRDDRAPRLMDHMRIQKLAYLAYGHHLVETDVVLCEEAPQIWPQGPGFIEIYLALQAVRGEAITHYIRTPYDTPNLDGHRATRDFLKRVEAHYARCDTLELAALAHAPESAWYRAASTVAFRCPRGTAIAPEHFRATFKRIA